MEVEKDITKKTVLNKKLFRAYGKTKWDTKLRKLNIQALKKVLVLIGVERPTQKRKATVNAANKIKQ